MIVKPIDAAMIQQMNDVSQIKQNENTKPMVEQQNINMQVQKEVNTKSEQVTHKDDTGRENKKFDAEEKSDNEYYQDPRGKRHKSTDSDGKVSLKKKENYIFDVKI